MIPATLTFITGTYKGKERAFAFGVWGGVAAAAQHFWPYFRRIPDHLLLLAG